MDSKTIIAFGALILISGLLLRYRQQLLRPTGLAFFMALAWTTYYRYEYVGSNIFLFDRINVYPLILWTTGPLLLAWGSLWLPRRWCFMVLLLLYYFFLAGIEVVGYYIFDIHLNSNYTSLLGLGVIHAPFIMKLFYVAAGPLYLYGLSLMEKVPTPSR